MSGPAEVNELLSAFSDLQELESRLVDGKFYEDYDRCWELVGSLRRHLSAIRTLAQPAAAGEERFAAFDAAKNAYIAAKAVSGATDKAALLAACRAYAKASHPLPASAGDADLLPLQRFADAVLDEWWESYFEGPDIQELGVKCGLLEEFTQPEPCDENCACAENGAEFPTTCIRRTPTLRRAILAVHRADAAMNPDAATTGADAKEGE